MSLDGHLDAAVGDATVEFTFTVRNAGADSIDLEFRSGKVADLAVYEDDVEIWRWSAGRMFTQAIKIEMLTPGEALTHVVSWHDPQPGAYTAVGVLDASDRWLERQVDFTV